MSELVEDKKEKEKEGTDKINIFLSATVIFMITFCYTYFVVYQNIWISLAVTSVVALLGLLAMSNVGKLIWTGITNSHFNIIIYSKNLFIYVLAPGLFLSLALLGAYHSYFATEFAAEGVVSDIFIGNVMTNMNFSLGNVGVLLTKDVVMKFHDMGFNRPVLWFFVIAFWFIGFNWIAISRTLDESKTESIRRRLRKKWDVELEEELNKLSKKEEHNGREKIKKG